MAARHMRPKRAPPSEQGSEPPVFISLDPGSNTAQLTGVAHTQEAAHAQRVPEALQQAQLVEGLSRAQPEDAQQRRKADKAKNGAGAPEMMLTAAEQTDRESEPPTEAFDAGAMRASLRNIYFDMAKEEEEPTSRAGSQKAAKQSKRAVSRASERGGTASEAQQGFSDHGGMRSRSSSSQARAQNGKQSSAAPEQRHSRTQHTAASDPASDASQSRSRSRTDRVSSHGTGLNASPRTEQQSKRGRDRQRIEELRSERREVSATHHHCPLPLLLPMWFSWGSVSD